MLAIGRDAEREKREKEPAVGRDAVHSGDRDRQSVETPCVRGWAVGRDATSQIVCTMFGPTGPIAFVHSCAFNWQSEETPLVRCWQSAETPPSGGCRQVWPCKTLGIDAVLISSKRSAVVF